MTPKIIKVFVSTYDNTIKVRMQAIRSDSLSVLPAFSPNALAQMRQMYLTLVRSRISTVFKYFN